MANFKSIKIGEKFECENKVWVKVQAVKGKKCCGNKNPQSFNARLVGNSKTTRLFADAVEVCIHEN